MKPNSSEPLENYLVWSAYRAKALGNCPRQYYYNCIGSWEGWNSESAPERQAAYRLKHLTTPELEIGLLIHRQVRDILEKARHGLTSSPANEIKLAQDLFTMFVEQSRVRMLETLTAKKKKLLLHELGEALSNEEMADYLERIATYLERFFQFADVRAILANPTVLIPEFLDAPGFEISRELGVPARLRTDALFVTANCYVIADWKSSLISTGFGGNGPSPDQRQQALVYDLFVRKKVDLPPTEKLEVRFYYLGSGQVETFEFTDEERAEKLWLCGEEFGELSRYSDDPKINIAPEERFHARVSRACFHCNFQQLCPAFIGSGLNAGRVI